MLNGIFDHLLFWHWWVLAIILFILEVFTFGAFFMWMGLAAIVTGLILLVFADLSWQLQFVLFAISSIAAIFLGRMFFNRKEINTEDPTLSQLESELIGKIVVVEVAIKNGSGRVRVGDTTWKAKGADFSIGTSVKVVAVSGTDLMVKAL